MLKKSWSKSMLNFAYNSRTTRTITVQRWEAELQKDVLCKFSLHTNNAITYTPPNVWIIL